MSGRPPAERRMGHDARRLVADAERWEREAAHAAAQAAARRSELAEAHRQACERFGVDLPVDGLLLDVLALVDVEPGDRWVWKGMRNNHGVPTYRITSVKGEHGAQERSVARYLALALGVIGPDEHGTLHSTNGDTDDVNPWHRALRRSDSPVGNFDRYRQGRAIDVRVGDVWRKVPAPSQRSAGSPTVEVEEVCGADECGAQPEAHAHVIGTDGRYPRTILVKRFYPHSGGYELIRRDGERVAS